MARSREHPEQDPVEGARDVIERELKREGDEKAGSDGKGKPVENHKRKPPERR